MIGLLPPVGAKGSFTLNAPFETNSDLVYECTSHTTLRQMVVNQDDPLNTLYLAKGLTEEDYNQALASDVLIVTLLSGRYPPILVPTTHITAYDTGSYIDHEHLIVTASCGLFPVGYDSARIKEAVRNALQEYVGVEAEVFVVVKDTTKKVTEAEAEAAEANRQAAMTYTSTTFKDKSAIQAKYDALLQDHQTLIQMYESLINPDTPAPGDDDEP